MLLWVVLSLFFGLASAHFAQKRGRDAVTWFVIGVLLGVFGVILLFILPPASREEMAGSAHSTMMSLKQTQDKNSIGNWSDQSEATGTKSKPSSRSKDSPLEGLPNNYQEIDWFYLDENHRQHGPILFKDVQLAYQRENVVAATYLWCEGMEDWKPLAELKGLEPLLEGESSKSDK